MGDVNGDGISDLVVISYAYQNQPVYKDTVFIDVLCGNTGWVPDAPHPNRRYPNWEMKGPTIGGLRLATLIDANADGMKDLYVQGNDSAYLFFGSPSLFNGDPGRVLPTPSWVYDGFFPYAFEIGDITGDGYKDFALRLAAQGMTFLVVYPGDAHGITYDRKASDYNQYHTLATLGACGPVGDINGDGVNDFAAGAYAGANWGGEEGYFVIYSGDTTLHPDPVAVTAAAPIAEQLRISAPYPNPATGSSRIACTAQPGTAYNLAVYDLLGRRVRTLDDGVSTIRDIVATWDGRDAAGHVVPSGVYLITLQTSTARISTTAVRFAH
jgi:hypothetical protein